MSQDFVTTCITISPWKPDPSLESIYFRPLHAIAEHSRRAPYNVILHGSVLWGDRTILRRGVPVSDIDVLVVGNTISDLSGAVCVLRSIADAYVKSEIPLFKLSVKLRTTAEIAQGNITANELGALLYGQVLIGPSCIEVPRFGLAWFHMQAELAVATRVYYVAEQQAMIASLSDTTAIARYLAARLILDIATVALLLRGVVGRSYTWKVETFLKERHPQFSSKIISGLRARFKAALRTKKDPENNECGDITDATELLLKYCHLLGLKETLKLPPDEFWRKLRPLDIRDRILWQTAGRASF